MSGEVVIIILNYNGWRDTIKCLKSIYMMKYEDFHVILIDNGSTDRSVEKILKWTIEMGIKSFIVEDYKVLKNKLNVNLFEKYSSFRACERIIIIKSKKNRGYAGGMNLGIQFILRNLDLFNAEYILLLNNDTIVDKNFLRELVKVMERYNDVGVAGPCVYHYYTKEFIPVEQYIVPIPFASILRSFFDNLFVDKKHLSIGKALLVNRLDGSCYIVRTKIFKEVGLLKEEFFSYWEDTEFFLRVKKNGYRLVYVPSSIIRHKVGSGFIGLKKVNPFAAYLMMRNAVHFINLHYKGLRRLFSLLYLIEFSFYYFFVAFIYFKNCRAAKASMIGLIKGFLGEKYSPSIDPRLL